MARMPNFEADAARALGWFENHIPGHHHTSAAQATATTPKENTMQLPAIIKELEAGAVNADNWMHTVLGTHVPALVAEVERFQGNPIVQELEAIGLDMLPPGDVAIITGIIRMAGRAVGQNAPAQQAVSQEQPADTQQAPAMAAEPGSDPRARQQ